MYNQNQKDILNYANQILANDFPTGILMVDDNWQRYYGNFDFKAEKFDDARAMNDELHRMGFDIMVWVCPFVSPDTPEFREMRKKGYVLKNKSDGQPAIIRWWNGYSACLDTTNPEATAWFKALLRKAQEKYGIDGFKFDAEDVAYMVGDGYKRTVQLPKGQWKDDLGKKHKGGNIFEIDVPLNRLPYFERIE